MLVFVIHSIHLSWDSLESPLQYLTGADADSLHQQSSLWEMQLHCISSLDKRAFQWKCISGDALEMHHAFGVTTILGLPCILWCSCHASHPWSIWTFWLFWRLEMHKWCIYCFWATDAVWWYVHLFWRYGSVYGRILDIWTSQKPMWRPNGSNVTLIESARRTVGH